MVSSPQEPYYFRHPKSQTRWWHFIDCQYDNVLSCQDREKYTLQKKSNTPTNITKSQEVAVNEAMETITSTHDSHTDRTEPLLEVADKEDLLSLFDQYSYLMSLNSEWLSTGYAIIINEVSVEGISATYHFTAQQCSTTALFYKGANVLITSQIFCWL